MKIDRLLGILTILSQCNKTTAPELAKKFEVHAESLPSAPVRTGGNR